jgi:hypothetical protein
MHANYYMVCTLHCIWRPVSSQQTSMTRDPWKLDSVRSLLHLLDCPPVATGHCPPPWSWPPVCARWFCLSGGLALLLPWLDLDCLSLHSPSRSRRGA